MTEEEKKEADDLLRSSMLYMRCEINFIILHYFLRLPLESQAGIYDQLNSGNKSQILLVGQTLFRFIQENSRKMAEFVSSKMTEWKISPPEVERKAYYMGLYFKIHLQKQLDGTFSIRAIK